MSFLNLIFSIWNYTFLVYFVGFVGLLIANKYFDYESKTATNFKEDNWKWRIFMVVFMYIAGPIVIIYLIGLILKELYKFIVGYIKHRKNKVK